MGDCDEYSAVGAANLQNTQYIEYSRQAIGGAIARDRLQPLRVGTEQLHWEAHGSELGCKEQPPQGGGGVYTILPQLRSLRCKCIQPNLDEGWKDFQ